MLKSNEMVNKLKSKGVKFDLTSEEEAEHFLNYKNYYVKVTAYRSNFNKHKGKYVGLDFKALEDLSTIDMYLKHEILKASLNVEHCLKVNILRDIENKSIDDYKIVKSYLKQYPKILSEIKNRRKTSYSKNLLQKYNHPSYPVWVFLEVIPFGEFVNFYRFYSNLTGYSELEPSIMYGVRNIRNAAAHNNCVIHSLKDKSGYYNNDLVNEVENILSSIKRRTIQDRLKNESVQDFVSLLIASNKVHMSKELKVYSINGIKDLYINRMVREKSLYKSAPSLNQMYEFTKEVLDKVYEM